MTIFIVGRRALVITIDFPYELFKFFGKLDLVGARAATYQWIPGYLSEFLFSAAAKQVE